MPHALVEIRDAGAARAAAVLSDTDGRLILLLADGRQLRVPRSRVVHEAGALGGTTTEPALRQAIADFERDASDRVAAIDLATLHELIASDDGAVDLSLSDLATLALGEDSPVCRAAVHRAMAAPNAFFRYTGAAWQAKTRDEVEADLERDRKARELEEERRRFVAAARARLAGGTAELPEGSAKFVRSLRDVAIFGDAARLRREASTIWSEIRGRPQAEPPGAEDAFDALVALGVLHRDENLPLLRAGVRVEFPPEVLEEAARLAATPIDQGRLDLRGVEIVTIDDVSTLEVDDGISLETTRRGLRIGIHISDAAHLVPAGSLTDDEALQRATSYYLPERSLRMLPPCISERAASLVVGEDRPALSFLVETSPHAEVVGFEIARSVVNVARRMSYEDCETALDGGPGPAWLRSLDELSRELERIRLDAGATPIRAAEVAIAFDAAGEPIIGLIDPGRPARRLVSEMMILANRLAAEWCRDRGLPAIYRKQPPPTSVVPPPPRDRMDPVAANDFRRTLQRTSVSLEPGAHAGLGVAAYLQATSPIRRYQDLAMHRVIEAALAGRPSPYSREELQGIATSTEQAGRLARQVETETDHYWILRHLERMLNDVVPAVVLRVEDRRTWIELLDFAFVTTIAPRPDHVKGKELHLRVRAAKPRRGLLTLEELSK